MRAKGLILTAVVVVLVLNENVSADLIAHFKFDESSGLVAHDSVAGNDGAIQMYVGPISGGWVAGAPGLGNAYNFNGTDVTLVPLAALNGLDIAGANPSNVTFAYRKKGNNLPYNSTYPYAEDFFIAGTTFVDGWANWNPNVGGGGGVYQQGHVGPISAQIGFVNNMPPGAINEWHHYAVVKDFAANTVKVYMDGVVRGTVAGGNAMLAAPTSFRIGGGAGTSFNGAIDDFRVYNTALTDAQLLALASIPEPATWALFGLGSLALLRRKRSS